MQKKYNCPECGGSGIVTTCTGSFKACPKCKTWWRGQ